MTHYMVIEHNAAFIIIHDAPLEVSNSYLNAIIVCRRNPMEWSPSIFFRQDGSEPDASGLALSAPLDY